MERQGAARILGDTGEQSPGRGGSETPAPLGIPDGRGRDIVTRAGLGRAGSLLGLCGTGRAGKPGRERRCVVGMTSFRKEKGGEKESVTFKSVLSKSYCVPLALLCWPFLAERDLGLGLAKPGLVWCQLLGSFPENLSFFGKRVLGTWLPARIHLQSFPDSAGLWLCSVLLL